MVSMWDEMFSMQDFSVREALMKRNGKEAFFAMHRILDSIWEECDRVLIDGGFICINIGDATRKIDDVFQLYPNYLKVTEFFFQRGYSVLPDIIWHKPSNAPNKFMGSGMLPAGAYVTYEHEHILIFRKGKGREFSPESKKVRQKSACFFEERNAWFSDIWEVRGVQQKLKKSGRSRSAAFPFDIPYRLISMYSIEGDTVLDPFGGIGTTVLSAMASQRNSIIMEIDSSVRDSAFSFIEESCVKLNSVIEKRLRDHVSYVESLSSEKKEKCYRNRPHGFPVKTRQETEIRIDKIESIRRNGDFFDVGYLLEAK